MTTMQDRDHFHALLKTQYDALLPTPLTKFQKMGWNRYLELGLPTKKNEVYRYIKLRSLFGLKAELKQQIPLTRDSIAPYLLPECRASVLVFVNGRYAPSLSQTEAIPEKVSIVPLEDAAKMYGAFLTNHWTKSLKEENDPFAAVNIALQGSGAFLYIPPKTRIESPIQILNLMAGSSVLAVPRVQSFLGAQARVQMISTHAVLEGKDHFVNHVNDFTCEEGSEVILYQTDDSGHWHLEATRAALKQGARFETVKVTRGSPTSRYDYKVYLLGENGEASLNSLGLLCEKGESHDNVLIRHSAPHCRSNQLFKNVLFDQSHSSFEGKIYVEREAQKTEAYQLNANLLLSKQARAESKPNLEIFADDVSASHGATFGQLEQEELFYLKTRGFTEEAAKRSLIAGTCREIFDKITVPSLLTRFQSWL